MLGTKTVCSATKESGSAKAVSRGRRLGACDFKLSDDASLVATDGWNVLSESCVLGSKITVGSGKTMMVRKDLLVSDPVIIDNRYDVGSGTGGGLIFHLNAGSLEMVGVTLTGGSIAVSFVCCVFFYY